MAAPIPTRERARGTGGPPVVPLAHPLKEVEARGQGEEARASSGLREDADPVSLGSTPGDPWGDDQTLGVISVRALLQMRYTTTLASKSRSSRESYKVREDHLAQRGDGWEISRALLRLSSDPVPLVGFKMVLDFAQLIDNDPEDVVKQAYVTLRPVVERFEVTAGLFKVPYSVLELDPVSRYEFVDLGPSNDLVSDLGFAGRDLGVQAMVAPLRKPKHLRLYAGAFRGHSYDEHDLPAGSLAGRIETKPSKSLRFGACFVEHLQSVTYKRPFNTSGKDEVPNPSNPLYPTQKRWDRGRAWSVDVRYKKKGFVARGEYLHGDRVDVHERYEARSFWAAWGVVSYRIEAGSTQIIPAVRAEWFDSDREHPKGVYRTLSFGVSALFFERVRAMVDVTRTDVDSDTPLINQPKPLQQQPYLALDSTRIVAQLQLEL